MLDLLMNLQLGYSTIIMDIFDQFVTQVVDVFAKLQTCYLKGHANWLWACGRHRWLLENLLFITILCSSQNLSR